MGHCFFIATSWDNKPVSSHFRALSEELADRGHQVIVLIDGHKQVVNQANNNLVILTWPSKRPTKLQDGYFLYKLIRKYQPNCLIANFGASNMMMLLGGLMRIACRIDWYHTLSSQIIADTHISAHWLRFLQLRKRLVYKATTHIVANSKAGYDDVQKTFRIPENKCFVFYNSLTDPMENFPLNLNKSKGKKIVCVGRLSHSKGQDILIRAASIIKYQYPDIQIEFIGGGAAKESFLQLTDELELNGICRFLGTLSHEDVLKKMAAADVTVVPSRHEAFGLVNIESLAVGTPVVASQVDGIVDIIRDGIDGFLVSPDNPKLLAEKIIAILCNSEMRNKMGANGRQRFLNCFEQGGIVKNQVNWLERILEAKNKPPCGKIRSSTENRT